MSDYTDKAITNFQRNINRATDFGSRIRLLNEASTALQEKFGYTARYNEAGYVSYNDRDSSYKKINDAINTEMDILNDDYIEAYHQVIDVITLLPYTARQQIVALVEENLTATSTV